MESRRVRHLLHVIFVVVGVRLRFPRNRVPMSLRSLVSPMVKTLLPPYFLSLELSLFLSLSLKLFVSLSQIARFAFVVSKERTTNGVLDDI